MSNKTIISFWVENSATDYYELSCEEFNPKNCTYTYTVDHYSNNGVIEQYTGTFYSAKRMNVLSLSEKLVGFLRERFE